MEREEQPGTGLREFRPVQPTDGQTCSTKVPAATTPVPLDIVAETQGS